MGYFTFAFMNVFLGLAQVIAWINYTHNEAKLFLIGGCFNLLLSIVYVLLANLDRLGERNRHNKAADKFSNLLTRYLAGKMLPSDLMLETTGLTWNLDARYGRKFKQLADKLEVLFVELSTEEITEVEFKAQLVESLKSAK